MHPLSHARSCRCNAIVVANLHARNAIARKISAITSIVVAALRSLLSLAASSLVEENSLTSVVGTKTTTCRIWRMGGQANQRRA